MAAAAKTFARRDLQRKFSVESKHPDFSEADVASRRITLGRERPEWPTTRPMTWLKNGRRQRSSRRPDICATARMNGPGWPDFCPTVATLKLFGIERLYSEGFYEISQRMRNRPDYLPDRYSARNKSHPVVAVRPPSNMTPSNPFCRRRHRNLAQM
jgi:hypothetical protein